MTEEQFPGSLDWVIFAGQPEITGFSLSTTVTVKVHVQKFPAASVALYVFVVVPFGNTDPGGRPAVCVTVTPEQLSVATGMVHDTTALHIAGSLLTVMLAGQETKTGVSASLIVMVNEQEEVFPTASVAVYVMVEMPLGKAEPEGKPAVCAIVAPGQLSFTVGAVHVIILSQLPGEVFAAIGEGHPEMTGF